MLDPITLGLISLAILILLIALRMPIAYSMILVGGVGTVIMNGPMGVFEMEPFAKGTFGLVDILADLSKDKGAITIIGGGDSVAATELSGRAGDMSHISTGGGASLELMEGKVLPGVAALADM